MSEGNLAKLLETWEQLGPMEREVILILASRILTGQRQYGFLSPDKKLWYHEAHEEGLDMAVYLASALYAHSKRKA
jgi:hypothetical protein